MPTPVNQDRRPDFAFVSYDRWPRHRPLPYYVDAWDVVPNLAAEVVSPSDTVDELQRKIHEYFRTGIELVWVMLPRLAKIHVYESPTRIRVLTSSDVLVGGAVIPGFRLALAELFTGTTGILG